MQIAFYHLTVSSLEKTLPRLLEKILDADHRVVVRTGSEERLQALSYTFWTYTPLSFLPHGTAKEGYAEEQPIWLTTEEECPNNASVLILTEGVLPSNLEQFNRYVYLYETYDSQALKNAQTLDAQSQKGHITPTYWKQTTTGWKQEEALSLVSE